MAESPQHPREFGHYIALAQVGLEIAAPIGIGVALDYLFNWSPWGVIVGAVLGLVGGIGHLVSLTNRPEQDGSSKPQREDS